MLLNSKLESNIEKEVLRAPPARRFGAQSSGFVVWGLGFGVWGLGFGVWGLGFGV